MQKIEKILNKTLRLEKLTKAELASLLEIREKKQVAALFKTARKLRTKFFRDKIYIYGFLYISTYCRNNCRFCFYRSENKDSLRYRKNESEIIDSALRLTESGVHLIDLTMGEDPEFFDYRDKNRGVSGTGFANLLRLVESVKKASGLPLMVSPGVVEEQVLEELAGAGADWYACYQETHNLSLFKELRPGQNYEKRLQTKLLAHKYGLLTEEGVLAGVGETAADMVDSIAVMESLKTDQVRAMNFVPRKGTPMENFRVDDPLREMIYTAVMRLVFPDRSIPATLDVEGLSGLKKRLNAGANVVTSIVPPERGLAGVAQSCLDIDDNRRSISGVLAVAAECGLRAASLNDYLDWTQKRRSEKLSFRRNYNDL
ncbi:MAG: methylornithine synthase PylB [Candidatus Aminicenantes bacterium]|nr:methylornithine synthase PylB [Candidatus Aminicenantes bacterium]